MSTTRRLHPCAYAMSLALASWIWLAGLAHGLIIDEAVTWSVAPPLIEEEVRIIDGGSLTIEAGITVLFGVLDSAIQGHISVEDGGALVVAGTDVAPVTFNTSEQVNWARIRAREGSSITMNHALLRRAGQWDNAALVIETSTADIRNVTVEDSITDGVRINTTGNTAFFENITVTDCFGNAIYQSVADMSPTYAGSLTLTGNAYDGVVVTASRGGAFSVAGAVNWTQTAVPFFVSGWLRTGNGGSLTIAPGVEVRFIESPSAKQSLIAAADGGTISALGTFENPIVFSSGLALPEPGDWSEVSIWEGGTGDFAYCEFQYGGNFGTPSILIESSDVTVDNCTIADSADDGIRLAGDDIAPVLDGLTIADCGGAALRQTTANMTPDIGNNLNFTDNAGGDAIFVTVSTDVDQTVTWPVVGTPYAISGWLEVAAGGLLSIQPGVEVQFAPTGSALQSNIDIVDGGAFDAAGTILSRVRFTSFEDTPAAGDWAFLRFQQGATASMTYADVEFAGQFGSPAIIAESSTVTLDHIEVRDCADEGIELNGEGNTPSLSSVTVRRSAGWGIRQSTINMDPQLSNILLRDNAEGDAVLMVSGTSGAADIMGDVAWEFCGAPYALSGWTYAAAGSTVTIDPGVVLQFAPSGAFRQSFLAFRSGAALDAEGTRAARILFTSSSATPAPGDWDGVFFNEGSDGSLAFARLEYAGAACLVFDASGTSLTGSIVRNAAGTGITAGPAGLPVMSSNDILNNVSMGATNPSGQIIDMQRTWWGDVTGPFHPTLNPDGNGNEVGDNIQFEPWATAPHQLPCLAASPRTYRFGPDGGSETVEVINTGYEGLTWSPSIVSGGDWLDIATSKVDEGGSVLVTAAPYAGEYQRAGVVRLSAPGAALEEVQIIIGQNGSLGIGPMQSADQDADNDISLSELLRVIQFFNSGGLSCDEGTEDGYAPGPGDTSCAPHTSDYNAQDWNISLSELLRVIQFFNSGGYHVNVDGEDGFGAGMIP